MSHTVCLLLGNNTKKLCRTVNYFILVCYRGTCQHDSILVIIFPLLIRSSPSSLLPLVTACTLLMISTSVRSSLVSMLLSAVAYCSNGMLICSALWMLSHRFRIRCWFRLWSVWYTNDKTCLVETFYDQGF